MTWEECKEYFKGKMFMIGLSFVDKDGLLIEQYQTHGIVSELTNDGLFKIKQTDNSIFQIPYDLETIEEAENGEYKEKATDFVVINPDFITTWEICVDDEDDLDEMKKHGFINPV